MPVLEVGGVRLWFTDSGVAPGDAGPSLLLVHGWTCDSHDWSFQLDAFEVAHRVVAVDLRGHGRSSVADGGYGAQRYAADLAELLAWLETGPVVAVGHSLGASVVTALAVEHPGLVLATVVVEPAYGQDEVTTEWLRQAAEQFGDPDGNVLAARLMEATDADAPAWLRTWHRRRVLGMDPGLLKQTFRDMYFSEGQFSAQPHTDAYLARRRCPNLAFHRLPAMAEWERHGQTHPASRVVSWEGAGHWLHQQWVEEFNSLVLAWVDELPGTIEGHDLAPAVSRSTPQELSR